MTDAVLYDAWL